MTDIALAFAQINPTVGDIRGNAAMILDYYEQAKKQGADLVLCPELSLVGYPPEDLILTPAFVREAMAAARQLAKKTAKGPGLIIGCPWKEGRGKSYNPSPVVPHGPWDEKQPIFNAALLLDGGKVLHVQPKVLLPNYAIFDEKRLFARGKAHTVVRWRGHRLGLLVCEDVWSDSNPLRLKEQGAEIIIVINASPFEAGKLAQRRKVAQKAVRATRLPLAYVNAVGGQDDIVFDGGSFLMSAAGEVTFQAPQFAERLFIAPRSASAKARPAKDMPAEEALWNAMALGLSDYVRKNGFSGVVLGLSGGIDSALAAALACDALGAGKVQGVLLPSPYTSHESVDDAQETARLLGIETVTIPISAGMEIFDEVLSPHFKSADWMDDLAVGGNLQARLRGMTLMAVSNRFGWMLLATSNKSEVAVGYTTLYGDSCGGYAPLKDLYKTQVYALARWRNKHRRVIPARSITRAPTAELAPGQTDQDQLPPYARLDKILMLHLEGRLSAKEIVARGHPRAMVEKILRMVRLSEYKRRQSPPGVKLSPMLFGRDRRFPLTNKF